MAGEGIVAIAMFLDDIWALFKENLFPFPSTPGLFNQYKDTDLRIDQPIADDIRRGNLKNYLHSFTKRPSIVVIGEAAGWRGCRFSGIPFTSEKQLGDPSFPFNGQQSSNQATRYAESTATTFWKHLLPFHHDFFAWNCVPFHPYQASHEKNEGKYGNILSNRAPTKDEIFSHSAFLAELLKLIKPKKVIAIGRSAEKALTHLEIPSTYVRHPSHGGARQFKKNIIQCIRD